MRIILRKVRRVKMDLQLRDRKVRLVPIIQQKVKKVSQVLITPQQVKKVRLV